VSPLGQKFPGQVLDCGPALGPFPGGHGEKVGLEAGRDQSLPYFLPIETTHPPVGYYKETRGELKRLQEATQVAAQAGTQTHLVALIKTG
jgi:hypothetical protein